MSFLLFNILIFIIIVFLLVVLSFVWPPDSPWAPWWRTSKDIADAACKLSGISKKDIVYELGSGEGKFLITAAKKYGATCIGIEIDPLRVLLSKIFVTWYRLSDKVTIKKMNFFDEDLSKATVLYCYLVPKALKKLKSKFLKELKPGTRIISYHYQIDLELLKQDENHELYLYRIP